LSTITAFVKRHPLVGFFILAYALTWPLIPLVSVSPLFGLPALFGPALAAIIVAAVVDGGRSGSTTDVIQGGLTHVRDAK